MICPWVREDELMIQYHNNEWGRPLYEDQKLFEFLMLESAQAGLSWKTILHKRENYRKAYSQFEVQKIARWTDKKIEKLMENPGIIRNKKKIVAARTNARAFLDIVEEFGSFSSYQWEFVGGEPMVHKFRKLSQIPSTTKESEAFAKDLKARGFIFLGPTTVYAHMQACGMVNDHLLSCPYHKQCL